MRTCRLHFASAFAILGQSLAMAVALTTCMVVPAKANEPAAKTKLLLIGQGPDGHPKETHEYLAGVRLVRRLLRDVADLEVSLHAADGDWNAGPDLIRNADGIFLFVSEGAQWIQAEPRRREAFAQFARRGGAIVAWHWALGTRASEPIEEFLQLTGGCHGGSDRKYQVVETTLTAAPNHPIAAGLKSFQIRDEFYYRLKFVRAESAIQPVLTARIDGQDEVVAWSWERPQGGRSFGFSGGHFHANWRRREYQQLVAHAILWSLRRPLPAQGFPAELVESDFVLP